MTVISGTAARFELYTFAPEKPEVFMILGKIKKKGFVSRLNPIVHETSLHFIASTYIS